MKSTTLNIAHDNTHDNARPNPPNNGPGGLPLVLAEMIRPKRVAKCIELQAAQLRAKLLQIESIQLEPLQRIRPQGTPPQGTRLQAAQPQRAQVPGALAQQIDQAPINRAHVNRPRINQPRINEPGRYDSVTSLETGSLRLWADDYLRDCELRRLSADSMATRRIFINNLLWFLNDRGYEVCGVSELREFFYYLLHGHEEPGGRWGKPHLKRAVRPITVKDYDAALRTMFAWFVQQGALPESPFAFIPKPRVQEGTKPPLSQEQILALLQAAQESTAPTRNKAILALLLDTGCRVSELISIRIKDIDMQNRSCQVLGKGNKYRTVYFGHDTAELLAQYLQANVDANVDAKVEADEDSPLFSAAMGGQSLTRSGLLHLIKRLGKKAGIKASCSPHALRRSFAVHTLRHGANVFSVQAMLGHTNLQMTQRYCALAQADVEEQHRQFSPVDRLKLNGEI